MSNLPQKDDTQRSEREREAINARNKVGQVTDALKEGKLPSTGEVTRTIETFQRSDTFHDSARGMSPLGKKVLADVEKLLDTTKRIFEEKNTNDELQTAIYHSGKATKNVGESVTIPEDLKNNATTNASSSQSLAQDAFKKTLIIPRLLMSSSEFRKLINDIHSIIQDALLRTIPNKEPTDTGPIVGSDQEKTIQQATQETKQQAREGTYPIAKEAANIAGGHLRDFSEGNKGFQETTTGGAKQLATHFKDKVSGYQITEEQRDLLVSRFKNLMIETQSKPEYQSVLEDLVDIISRVADHSKEITDNVVNTAKQQVGGSVDKSDLQIAQENAKKLIENFANHKSLDPLIDALRDLGNNVRRDEDMKSFLKELKQFVASSLRDPQFVQETDYVEHGSRLIERGRYLLLDRYSDDTQRISDEAAAFNKALQDDSLTSQWSRDFEALVHDLFLDEKNRPTVKFELIKDFRRILPTIGERFKYLALPRIENSDEEYDYAFDNVVLHLADVVPNHLHMIFTTDINLERDDKDVLQNTAYIEISKINADARNIEFSYKKKKGLINMADAGRVDFSIPKNGLTIKLKVLLNPPNEKDQAIDLRVLESDANIDDLKFRLHDTKHDFLYTLLTPLVEKRLKKQLANMISERMVKFIDFTKENISKVQSQMVNQVNDVTSKRKELKEKRDEKRSQETPSGDEKQHKEPKETPVGNEKQHRELKETPANGEKKQKHAALESQQLNSNSQIKEE